MWFCCVYHTCEPLNSFFILSPASFLIFIFNKGDWSCREINVCRVCIAISSRVAMIINLGICWNLFQLREPGPSPPAIEWSPITVWALCPRLSIFPFAQLFLFYGLLTNFSKVWISEGLAMDASPGVFPKPMLRGISWFQVGLAANARRAGDTPICAELLRGRPVALAPARHSDGPRRGGPDIVATLRSNNH